MTKENTQENEDRNPGGRPTSYDPVYCDMIIDYMSGGKSKDAFAGHIGVAKSTIYEWIKKHREFSNSVKIAEAKCQDFWEELGVVGTTEGKNFNASTWIFNMKNRFGWRDKTEVDHTSQGKRIVGFNYLPPESNSGHDGSNTDNQAES